MICFVQNANHFSPPIYHQIPIHLFAVLPTNPLIRQQHTQLRNFNRKMLYHMSLISRHTAEHQNEIYPFATHLSCQRINLYCLIRKYTTISGTNIKNNIQILTILWPTDTKNDFFEIIISFMAKIISGQ